MTTALAFFQLLEEASEEAVRPGESSQICCFKESEKGCALSPLWGSPALGPGICGAQHQSRYGRGLFCRELEYGSSLVLQHQKGDGSW